MFFNYEILKKFNNDYITKVIIIFLTIFYPIFSLPFILIEIYNKKSYAYSLFSIWLGLFAILYAPHTDYYRHLQNYFLYKNVNWQQFLDEDNRDFILPLLSFIFVKIGISFELIRFFIVVTTYESIFYIYKDISNKNICFRNRRFHFIFFLIIFFSSGYFGIIIGLRWIWAVAIFCLGAYKLFIEENKIGYLYVLLSIFIHFAIIPFILLTIISNKTFKVSKLFAILVFLLCCFLSAIFFEQLILILGDDSMVNHLDHYVNGEWGSNVFEENLNRNAMIHYYLSKINLIPLVLYILYIKWNNNSYLLLIIYSSLICGLSLEFPVILGRYLVVFSWLVIFYIAYTFSFQKFKMFCYKFLLLISIFTFSMSLYIQRKFINYGREYMWLYTPSFVILANNYDQQWINQNFDDLGFPKN